MKESPKRGELALKGSPADVLRAAASAAAKELWRGESMLSVLRRLLVKLISSGDAAMTALVG